MTPAEEAADNDRLRAIEEDDYDEDEDWQDRQAMSRYPQDDRTWAVDQLERRP